MELKEYRVLEQDHSINVYISVPDKYKDKKINVKYNTSYMLEPITDLDLAEEVTYELDDFVHSVNFTDATGDILYTEKSVCPHIMEAAEGELTIAFKIYTVSEWLIDEFKTLDLEDIGFHEEGDTLVIVLPIGK